MKIYRKIRSFLSDDDGAVTADWVVLCGAVTLLGVGVLILIEPGVDNGAQVVSEEIGNGVLNRVAQDGSLEN